MDLVTLADIRTAAGRIAGHAVRTPLLPLRGTGTPERVWLKAECLQPVGSFKIRGAVNAVAALSVEGRARGVVGSSSGNHAQALAYAAAEHGVPAVIVMPDTSPAGKVAATDALGAEVVIVAPAERDIRAAELAVERGLALVPPFDHPEVIAGQGTVGLEITEDMPEVHTVFVPASGGGLVSGVATAVKALAPHARVVAVEPELAADLAESFARGERVAWDTERTYRTIADGLRTPAVGVLPWAHIRARVDAVLTVGEDTIRAAMRLLATRARLVAEPSGAVALAALLEHPGVAGDGSTVVVVSGGNVEPALLAEVLAAPAAVVHG